jgi:hypothetical protein
MSHGLIPVSWSNATHAPGWRNIGSILSGTDLAAGQTFPQKIEPTTDLTLDVDRQLEPPY